MYNGLGSIFLIHLFLSLEIHFAALNTHHAVSKVFFTLFQGVYNKGIAIRVPYLTNPIVSILNAINTYV